MLLHQVLLLRNVNFLLLHLLLMLCLRAEVLDLVLGRLEGVIVVVMHLFATATSAMVVN